MLIELCSDAGGVLDRCGHQDLRMLGQTNLKTPCLKTLKS